MKRLKSLIAAIAIMIPISGQTIGRTGNGRMASIEDGFVTNMPSQLPDVQAASDGSLKCMNPAILDSSGSSPSVIVHRFAVANQSRANMDRDSLKLELLANDWHPVSFPQDPCVDLYVKDQGSVLALIGVWGGGKGFEVIGARDGFTRTAINEIVSGLVLDRGACAWM
jgi:hypothetical protein